MTLRDGRATVSGTDRPGSQELGRREPSRRIGTLNPAEVMEMQSEVPPASGSARDLAAS